MPTSSIGWLDQFLAPDFIIVHVFRPISFAMISDLSELAKYYQEEEGEVAHEEDCFSPLVCLSLSLSLAFSLSIWLMLNPGLPRERVGQFASLGQRERKWVFLSITIISSSLDGASLYYLLLLQRNESELLAAASKRLYGNDGFISCHYTTTCQLSVGRNKTLQGIDLHNNSSFSTLSLSAELVEHKKATCVLSKWCDPSPD